jgi:hypothetical protein
MRMGLDLGLHRALDRLAEDPGKPRSQDEERDLSKSLSFVIYCLLILDQPVVSARIWLCLFWFDHQ